MKIPLYTFSHQEGHISAALFGSQRTDLFDKQFIAFHVSGGTTEAVFVKGFGTGFSVELAKKYTIDESKFVNGILGTYSREFSGKSEK